MVIAHATAGYLSTQAISLLKSVAATFRPWRGDASGMIVGAHRAQKEPIVPNALRPRPFRHQTVAFAFIMVLLMIAVGTVVRAW